MSAEDKKTTTKAKIKTRIEVPAPEEVRVIDMKLGELFLGVIACATLAGVGFTYYAHVKAHSDACRIDAIAKAISAVTGDIIRAIPNINSMEAKVPPAIVRQAKTIPPRKTRKKGGNGVVQV